MSTKEQQVKNSLVYLLPIIFSNLIPFLTIPVFTRILSTDDYGVLALAQVYAMFATGVANFGMIIGFERNFFQYGRDDKGGSRKIAQLLYSVLIFVSVAILIVGVGTYLFRDHLAKWIIGSSDHGDLLFLAFCTNAFLILNPYFFTYYKNIENAKANVLCTVIATTLSTLISFYLIVFAEIGISGILWGQLISGSLISVVLLSSFLQKLPFAFSWVVLKNCLTISYPLTPIIFLKVIGTQFDKYMIGLLESVGGVGVYNIGQRISNLVFTFMTALQSVFSPQVYKKMFAKGEEAGKDIGVYLTPFIYISMAAGVGVSLFSEEIIRILTPPSFHGATEVVIILSMYYGIMFFGKQPQLIYEKKTHITSVISFISILLNVVLNIPFIMKWGINGAAWATFLAGLLSVSLSFVIAQHYYKIDWEYRKLAAIYILFFISSIAMISMRSIGIDYLPRVFVKLAFLASYIYLGVKLKIITKENILLLKSFLPSRS
jgi:O-antigen/teichoic acid export membrane protein